MSITETISKKDREEDEIEIRLGDIVQFIKDSRWVVLRWVIGSVAVGIIYVFSKQNQYTSIVKVMPELKSSGVPGGLGDLKSLAGLAGVSLNGPNASSEAVRPDLYPDILQSVPFSLHLLNQRVTTSTNAGLQSLQDYLTNDNQNAIASFLSGFFAEDTDISIKPTSATTAPTLRLTRQQEALSKEIHGRVNADMDKKSGIITITSEMPDPVVAATVARQSLDYLTNYVTNYRTSKSRQQAQFLAKQVDASRRRYESAELRLSIYRDRNRSLFTNTAKIEEQRLQADYLLAQTVYNDLEKQLEQAKIKVEEESPVFQILEPAKVPLKKSGPKRLLIIIGFSIVGAFIGLILSFIKKLAGQ